MNAVPAWGTLLKAIRNQSSLVIASDHVGVSGGGTEDAGFRLFWERYVNRGDLMDAFRASVNQASTDRNRYISMAPDNIVYDKSARTNIRGSQFEPLFLKPNASRYPSQLRSVADGILDRADVWTSQLSPYDAAPNPLCGVKAKAMRSFVAVIRRLETIKVKYQSLSWPQPRCR